MARASVVLPMPGSPRTSGGVPIETYSDADIAGLAKVFTGWSWQCVNLSDDCFNWGRLSGVTTKPDWFSPMVSYSKHFSEDSKAFLGVTIPARVPGLPLSDLTFALDTLANHPNVGPFIGRQLRGDFPKRLGLR